MRRCYARGREASRMTSVPSLATWRGFSLPRVHGGGLEATVSPNSEELDYGGKGLVADFALGFRAPQDLPIPPEVSSATLSHRKRPVGRGKPESLRHQ